MPRLPWESLEAAMASLLSTDIKDQLLIQATGTHNSK